MRTLMLWFCLLGTAWAQEADPITDPVPAAEEQPETASDSDLDRDSEIETPPVLDTLDGSEALDMESAPARLSGPEDIEIPYVEQDAEAVALAKAEAEAALIEYCSRAKTVIIGTVLTSRVEPGFPDELVEVLIETSLRGDSGGVITARLPRSTTGSTTDGFSPPSVVEGYRLLVFLDPSGTVVDGQALFFMEAGHAFRNRRPDIFLKPRSDRDWIDNIDPSEDYIVYRLEDIEQALDDHPMRRNRARRRWARLFWWRR
jgi:hypothetical protein